MWECPIEIHWWQTVTVNGLELAVDAVSGEVGGGTVDVNFTSSYAGSATYESVNGWVDTATAKMVLELSGGGKTARVVLDAK